MNNIEMKKMFIRTCVFSAVAFAVMFQRIITNNVVVTDASDTKVEAEYAEDKKTFEADFTSLSGKYDKVVMVELEDLAAGLEVTEDGKLPLKDTGYLIAKELMILYKKDENAPFKLYFPNLYGESIDNDLRAQLMEDSGTDLYVKVGVARSSDASEFGIIAEYNEGLFLRSLSTAGFADILERHCAVCTGKKAVGIVPTEDEAVLSCSVPAARLCVGYTSNQEDVHALQDEAYIKGIASGIYQAALAAFDAMK